MSVIFKKTLRANPLKPEEKMYYPELITLGKSADIDSIAAEMKDRSSLSKGDILSVLDNFVEAMLVALYNGHSVNMRDFGVFSLSATTDGAPLKEKCTASNIRMVHINFRPSSSVRPSLVTTRGSMKLDFVDLDAYLKSLKSVQDTDGTNDTGTGGDGSGGDDGSGGGDDFVEPIV